MNLYCHFSPDFDLHAKRLVFGGAEKPKGPEKQEALKSSGKESKEKDKQSLQRQIAEARKKLDEAETERYKELKAKQESARNKRLFGEEASELAGLEAPVAKLQMDIALLEARLSGEVVTDIGDAQDDSGEKARAREQQDAIKKNEQMEDEKTQKAEEVAALMLKDFEKVKPENYPKDIIKNLKPYLNMQDETPVALTDAPGGKVYMLVKTGMAYTLFRGKEK